MAVYRILADSDTYNSVSLVGDFDVQNFDGRRLAKAWSPLDVEIYSKGRAADFLSFLPGALAMTRSVWEKLSTLLGDDAEALPLAIGGREQANLLALNIVRVENVLDRERSIIKRLPSGAASFPLEKYVFGKIDRKPFVFRIPETRRSELLATSEFCDLIARMGFVGLDFVRIDLRRDA